MSGWPIIRLDSCTDIVSGATPSTSNPSYWNGDICWATPKDVSEVDGAYISDTSRKITRAGLAHCSADVLPPQSVLFSSRAPIGHVAINTVPMATNQGFKSFVPHRDKLDPKFLYHWLRANRAYLEGLGNGATFKEVSKTVVSRIEVPLPPLPQQRRIADVLEKADALRAKRRAALGQLDFLTQSIFLDMFGDPIANPRKWPISALAALGTVERGVSKHRPRGATELLGGPYPLIQTGDVANCDGYIRTFSSTYSELGLRQSKIWPAGTLCITIAANIAKTGILTFDACFPDSVVAFRSQEVATVEFVRCYFSFVQASLELIAPESAQKNINLEILRKLSVPLPPLDLQREFARRTNAIEALRRSKQASLSQLDALFASLQHRAFRGEL